MQRNAVRMSLIAVTLAVALAAVGWGIHQSLQPTEMQWAALCGGMQFTPTELARLEAVLAQQDIDHWRVEDRRLLVPVERRHECLAALARAKALPQGLQPSSDQFLEDASPFDSRQTREYKHKLALQHDLSRVINTMQGVVEATVKYDVSPPTGLNQQREQRALAAVRVEDGRQLSLEQVVSIQHTIAASLAGMRPEDVTVTDLNGCKTWSGVLAPPTAYFANGAQPMSRGNPAPTSAMVRAAAMRPAALSAAAIRPPAPASHDASAAADHSERLAELWQTSLRNADSGRFQHARLHVRWLAGDVQPSGRSAGVARQAIGNVPAALESAVGDPRQAVEIEQPHLIAWIVVPQHECSETELTVLENDLKRIAQHTCPEAWSRSRVRQTVQVAWRDAARREDSTTPLDDSRTIHVSFPSDGQATASPAPPAATRGSFPLKDVQVSDAAVLSPVTPNQGSALFPLCGALAAVAGVWCWLFRGGAEEPAADEVLDDAHGDHGGEPQDVPSSAAEAASSPTPARPSQKRPDAASTIIFRTMSLGSRAEPCVLPR